MCFIKYTEKEITQKKRLQINLKSIVGRLRQQTRQKIQNKYFVTKKKKKKKKKEKKKGKKKKMSDHFLLLRRY